MPSKTYIRAVRKARREKDAAMRAAGLDPRKHVDQMEWLRRLSARVLNRQQIA